MHCALPPCVDPNYCGDAAPPPMLGKRNALIIGDSISIQYAPTVRELLGDEWFVWKNGGFCTDTKNGLCTAQWKSGQGGNSEHGVFCTEPGSSRSWLSRTSKWDVIHVNFGLHDAMDRTGVEKYESNVRALHARLQSHARRVIWATTTPVPDPSNDRLSKLNWTIRFLRMRWLRISETKAHGAKDRAELMSLMDGANRDERILAQARGCKASSASRPSTICATFAQADARWDQYLAGRLPNATLVPLLNAAMRRAVGSAAEPPCIDDLYGEVAQTCGEFYANCSAAHRAPADVHFSPTFAHTLALAVAASIRACAPAERVPKRTG